MRNKVIWTTVLLTAITTAGCSPPPPGDAGSDTVTMDTPTDNRGDTSTDAASPDVLMDASTDVRTDTAPIDANMDASIDVRTDAAPMDATVDARTDVQDVASDARITLFARCTRNADCAALGTGATCNTMFPGGLCTIRCTRDAQCGFAGICVSNMCWPECTSGAGECIEHTGNCARFSADDTRRICVPGCFEMGRVPEGEHACNMGTTCDPYTGICTDMPSMGADNGAPCMRDEDCRGGRCIPEIDEGGDPTGFLGGYCISFGRRPPDSDYVMGRPIPQSNCPTGSGVIPLEGALEGDATACLKTCNLTGSDCRPGYECSPLETRDGMRFSSNGVCLPINCRETGRSCPPGYVCRDVPSDAGVALGMCVRG